MYFASTAESTQEISELFHEDRKKALNNTKNIKITLIVGDFNAKVEKGLTYSRRIWPGVCNERGERLVQLEYSELHPANYTRGKHQEIRLTKQWEIKNNIFLLIKDLETQWYR